MIEHNNQYFVQHISIKNLTDKNLFLQLNQFAKDSAILSRFFEDNQNKHNLVKEYQKGFLHIYNLFPVK